MLYSSFRASVLIVAILGFLHMIAEGSYIYIFFPFVIIVWAIYSFFDENDSEYLRRNGIDPDEISWFFPDYSDYGAVRTSFSHNRYNNNRTFPTKDSSCNYRGNLDSQYTNYMPKTIYPYNNPNYKGFSKKCRRSFKITVSKEETEKND